MYVGTNGSVFGLDPLSGAVVKPGLLLTGSVGVGDYTTTVATDGTTLLAGTHGYVYAVKLSDWSKAAWSAGVGGSGAYEPVALLHANGTFYAGSNGHVYQFDAGSGNPVHDLLVTSWWPTGGDYTTSLATDGKTLYVGVHGYVYAVSLSDWSRTRWSAGVGGTLQYQPVSVLWDGSHLFAGSNGYVYQLDPANGSQLHGLLVTGPLGAGDYTTRIATDGASLYAGVHGYVYGVALSDWSKTAWNFPVGMTATYPRVDVLARAGAVFAAASGYVYQIDPLTRTLVRTLLLASLTGIGSYDTQLATDGFGLYAGMHGYAYRVLTLDDQGIGPAGFTAAAVGASNALHVIALDAAGGIWHTIRDANGSWPQGWGNVSAVTRAPFPSAQIAAATAFAGGSLAVLALDPSGTLWEVVRNPDGSWTAWTNVTQAMASKPPALGPLTAVAAAADPTGKLHLLVLDAQRNLWHTLRAADGSWPYPWGNVQAAIHVAGNPVIGPLATVAAAAGPNGDLHLVVLDESDRPYYTKRNDDGSWIGWVDVVTAVGNPPIGQLRYAAAAIDGRGQLSVLAVDRAGGLWHTIRLADGSWPYGWGNVNDAISYGGINPPLDRTALVAGAINTAGDMHVLALDEPAGLYHTMRATGGTWPVPWVDILGTLAHRS